MVEIRTNIKIIVIALALVVCNNVYAQNQGGYPRVRSLLMERQLVEVKKIIVIENRDIPLFDNIYRRYINDLFELNAGYEGLVPLDSDLSGFTESQIEDIFIRQTEKSKRMLIIKEKYYYEFKNVLTPREIIKLYAVERQILRSVQQEMRDRMRR